MAWLDLNVRLEYCDRDISFNYLSSIALASKFHRKPLPGIPTNLNPHAPLLPCRSHSWYSVHSSRLPAAGGLCRRHCGYFAFACLCLHRPVVDNKEGAVLSGVTFFIALTASSSCPAYIPLGAREELCYAYISQSTSRYFSSIAC